MRDDTFIVIIVLMEAMMDLKSIRKAINMGIKEITFTEHMTMPEDIVIEGMGDDF